MSKRGPKKDLKKAIEDELRDMLEAKGEPNEQRMKLLKLGIGYLAVQAKLEETEYGGFFESEKEEEKHRSSDERQVFTN